MDRVDSLEGGRRTKRAADVEVLVLCCECGRRDCGEALHVSLPTLEWARSRGLTVVAQGHQGSRDSVVERTTSFVLVRSAG